MLERIIKASSNPGDIVLDAFCGCGTTLVAARNLGRRFVGIDISPSSCNVMGRAAGAGLRAAPGAAEPERGGGRGELGCREHADVPARDSAGGAGTRGQDDSSSERGTALPRGRNGGHESPGPTGVAYYRFSNLPRSAEQLRALPGFEFENWAVLQLGEVLKHHGQRIRAQVNRAKVGDFGLDGKIYIVTNASIKRDDLPRGRKRASCSASRRTTCRSR